ncbi:MAG: Adenylosuccinate synthetase [Methanonatronarchaeales archaeon]|nr:Adenylosuccinate synthetase [Methanonatronarchaeales archaeon]
MTAVVVVGTQLGDEGKGKVIDLFSERTNLVVRFQGGDNAGHTVVVGDDEFKLHLVPSGSVRGKRVVVGNGCVVNPEVLLGEIGELKSRGIEPEWFISGRAHVIMPYHIRLDGLEEDSKGEMAAGTTKRGIGPCYQDKVARRGVRVADLLDPDALREKLKYLLPLKTRELELYGSDCSLDLDVIFERYREFGERIADHVVEVSVLVNESLDRGENVLMEGAQGTHLDIDHGVYPFNTSSNTTSGGACTGSGVGVTRIDEVIGVAKAYLSRVGTGPLPTELEGETADFLVERGNEYGTTTGRRRRVGWQDVPMLRYSASVNGMTGLVVTSLDVLDGLDELQVCTHYRLDGEEVPHVPPTREWGRCEPVYEEFEPWSGVDWEGAAELGYDELDGEVRRYLSYLSEETGVEVIGVSVGPERRQTIINRDPF